MDTKLQVAEFLERITGERPVILHEQADLSRTTIEKFEAHAAEAGFAVVLLTADDVGGAKGEELGSRARQNVVLELGFFFGSLGRSRVVVLYEEGMELPSDIAGLLYKPLTGNWQVELSRELRAAGIEVDLDKVF
jgi:predicted nucleotide-binding protein